MSAQAIHYQINKYLGSNDSLVCYFDFSSGSAFSVQSGSVHQSYLRNQYPATKTGNFDGKVVGASGVSSSLALSFATGSGGFIGSGGGDFAKNYVEISGSSSINPKDFSYLFLVEPNLSKDGVIMGSFEKVVDTVDGEEFVSSKGFNFGTTSRGHLFFQSLSRDGEHCFVANELELSKKNVLGLSFSNSSVKISRFDYLNDQSYSTEFPFDASFVRSNNIYLGSSPNYHRSGPKLLSGKLSAFAMLSGYTPEFFLHEIGKGLFSEYVLTSGTVEPYSGISGYVTSTVFQTGVTGRFAEITGYTAGRSGIQAFSQSVVATGNLPIREGERYYKGFSEYLEEVGFLSGVYSNSYFPTGERAYDTLGLQTGQTYVSGYSIINTLNDTNINTPLYRIVDMYGVTEQISGIVNTPVYEILYKTGENSSGIYLSGSSIDLQKDYIYYMGERQ